jgi:hypothetical protein
MLERSPVRPYAGSRHTREETYLTGLAHLVEAQHREPLARWFGAGTGATSDGLLVGQINRRHYGFVLDGKNRAVVFIGWSVRRAAKHG